jgi:RNA polymerase sigma factor (sigma-70 family)
MPTRTTIKKLVPSHGIERIMPLRHHKKAVEKWISMRRNMPKYVKEDAELIKKIGFKRRLEKFLTKPLPITDIHIPVTQVDFLTVEELSMPLEQLLQTQSASVFWAASKILKRWLIVRKEFLPVIFQDAVAYKGFVVLIALKILIRTPVVTDWLYNEIIKKVRIKPFDIHTKEDLRQEAYIHLVSRVIKDVGYIRNRAEPYLKRCINNFLIDYWRKHTKGAFPESLMRLLIPLDDSKRISGLTIPLDEYLACGITQRQLDIAIFKTEHGYTNKEIAKKLNVSERTVRRDMDAIGKNRELYKLLTEHS